jgi:D-amino-acid dehydrogenase
MRSWASQYALDFGFEANGMVFLFGSARARDEGRGLRDPLAQAGVVYADLAHDDLVALDPGYARISADLFALSSPEAGHGNALTFSEQLARLLTDDGVAIQTNNPVTGVAVERGRVVGVHSVGGLIAHERVVLCAGHQTALLARTAGVRPPILPVQGFAVTVPIRAEHLDKVPSVGGVLESAMSPTRDPVVIYASPPAQSSEESRRPSPLTRGRTFALPQNNSCPRLWSGQRRYFRPATGR